MLFVLFLMLLGELESVPAIIQSTLVYHQFCLEDCVLWLLFILISDTIKHPRGGPWKAIQICGLKQSIFESRSENCLSFSKKSPQKIV